MMAQQSRPARVLFVHNWGMTMAGGERWVYNLANHLDQQHVHVVAALHTRGPLYAGIEELGIGVHHVELDFLRATPRAAALTSGLGVLKSALRLRQIIVANDVDIVHAFCPEAAQPAYIAARMARAPVVVTLMNCGPWVAFDEHVLRHCDRVIPNSRAVEHDLLAQGLDPQMLTHIPIGIDMDDERAPRTGRLRSELGVESDTPLIGMVANLERKKAQDTLIRAMPAVLRIFPDAHVVFFGRDKESTPSSAGPYESDLRQLATDLGIANRVHLAGFRPDVRELIPDLDVSVLCSRRDAHPLAAVESLAAGLPFVATAIEGLPEIVDDGDTGLLVPCDDDGQLASAITTLLADRELAQRLAGKAFDVSRERFSASALARQNRAVYDDLLNTQSTVERTHMPAPA